MIARRRIAFPSVRFGGYERRLICCASRSNGPIRYWRRQISTVKASIATSIRASLTWLASAHLQRHLIEELRFARDSPLEESGFEPSVPPAKVNSGAAGRRGQSYH